MSSEPIHPDLPDTDLPGTDLPGTDPAALPGLPALFAAPSPARPGRVRGGFSMHPPAAPGGLVSLEQARARHATTTAPAATPIGDRLDMLDGPDGLDWGLVAAFRTLVATRLAQALGEHWREHPTGTASAVDDRGHGDTSPGAAGLVAGDRASQERFGWSVIEDLLAEHTADAAAAGSPAWSSAQRTRIGQAVFDAVFRLGRLQPLVDDDRVENIFILGHGQTLLELVDGSRIPGPAVADSDEELVDFLRFLATRSESNPRPFSEGTPRLHMKLDGGARLAATAWVTSRPTVVIRRHRLKVDTLSAWVDRDGMSPACANLLGAAVRAGWSIAVSGAMSAGKTTLVRALCAQIPREEAIGTFETEYELFLPETGNHEIVIDWESRPGLGELGPDGRPAGAFELADALTDSFRFALSRQIVGEIRGPEVWTMIKAMESGTGSISTTHAASAPACLRKLVTCAMEAGPHVTRELATEKLAGALNLIVQLTRRIDTDPDGTQRLRRWVSEVTLVEPGEQQIGYSLTHLFGPDPHGPAHATGINPPQLQALARFGFDPARYQAEADTARWRP